jgi:hypothetical protein
MIALDVAWWIAGVRMAKRRKWQAVVSLFMAAQILGLLAIIGGRWLRIDGLGHLSKAIFAAVILWHFFGLTVLLPIGIVRGCVWLVRQVGRLTGARQPTPPAEETLTRREFVGATVALAPPLFNLSLTSIALAQLNNFRVRRFTLAVPNLPRDLDGLTIAHVSDIHVGRLTSGRVLRKMVEVTNNLRCDLVLLTGDLINDALSDLAEGIALVKALESRYGQWMIEGNHDLIENGAEFERRVQDAGIPFLLNEAAVTQVRGQPVQFFGLRWRRGGGAQRDEVTAGWIAELMRQRQPEAFPILLAHHPHAFDAAAAAGLPLILAGHTHGGQLMLDQQVGFGPVFFRYWSGLYTRGNSQMIVSNGVGNWFPIRINAPAEIVHLTLRRA